MLRRRLETLTRLTPALASTLSLGEVLQRITDAAVELLGSSHSRLWLLEEDGEHLSLRAASGVPSAVPGLRRFRVGEGLTGTVAATRATLLVEDCLADPRTLNRERIRAEGIVSLAGAPLLAGGRLLGVLWVALPRRHRYTPIEVALLESLASHAAIAIENARLFAEEHARREQLAALLEINKKIGTAETTEALLAAIAEEAARLLGVDNAGFRLVDGEDLVVAGLYGAARQTMLRQRIRIGESLSGRVVAEGRTLTVAIEEVPDLLVPDHLEAARRLGYRAYLGVPLRFGDRTIGVLALGSPRPFTARHRELAEAFAGQAAIALEHARLYREASLQAHRMSALVEVERMLSETLDPEVVAQRIVDSVVGLLAAQSATLYRLEPDGLRFAAGPFAPAPARADWIISLPAGSGLVGAAVRERRPLATADVLADPRVDLTAELRARGTRLPQQALLAAPLVAGGRVLGALAVRDRTGRRFTPDDVRLVQAFADQAATALENARLHGETEERLRETTTLLAVGQALSQPGPTGEVMRRVAREVGRAFGADTVGAYVLDRHGEALVPLSGYRVPEALREHFRRHPIVLARFPFARDALAAGDVVWSDDAGHDPRFDPGWVAGLPPHSVAFAPTRVRGRSVGGLFLVWWRPGRAVAPAEIRLLEGIAAQLGLALENTELAEQREARLRESELLSRLSRAVTGQLDRAALLDALRTEVPPVLGAEKLTVLLVDGDQVEAALRVHHGRPQPDPRRYPRRQAGLTTAVMDLRRPLRTDDYLAECRRRGLEPPPVEQGPRYWIGAPMIVGDEVLGALTISRESREFTEADERLVGSIADLVALAFRSARLYEERTRAYGELAAAQDHLVRTEKLRALGEMASGVAHDFNNLLAAILGRAQLLLREVQDPRLRQWLQVIERSATDGAQTVRRLQEFARVRRDQPRVPVDLNEIVRDALEITQARWREEALRRGIVIDVQTRLAPLPPVAGDPAELREALTNLILNAVDAMPGGGTLTCATVVADGAVEVTVTDTGVGIPDGIREKIFDPFFTTKGPQGTGLGLAMTYGIVSRHGGRIGVESVEGRGSTFRLTFPPAPAAAAEEGGADGAGAGSGPGALRCLVVDDEEAVGAVLGDVLEAAGHAAVVMTDGATAIERLRTERFDVVFTDLAMPGISGWQVARAAQAAAPGVPVFLVTGFGVELSTEERRAHGVAGVLAKPVKIEDIVGAVTQVARRHGRPQ